ncbi:MAG TPA: hypothetical protein VHD87_10425 [Acidimicrobiales bacterium]|nr:hypothetical protein [Acidimicrobiales bacterium]
MNPLRKAVIGGALVVSTMAGGAFGAALINGSASAATNTTTTAPSSSSGTAAPSGQAPPNFDPSEAHHVANGITETLLTGADAEKATAAALKAVPGGTIQRVETDADGDAYEAHMLDASGNPVTVKFDKDFNVTSTESGPAGGGMGHGAGGQQASSTSPTA